MAAMPYPLPGSRRRLRPSLRPKLRSALRSSLGSAVAALSGLASAGCGSSTPSGPGGALTAAPAVLATPPHAADDAPVAKVNGRTVWASCVAAQAQEIPAGSAAPADPRRAALDQCIAFELLAQAAEARGLAASSEVADAGRSAAVNRLIETDFEQHARTPADLAPQVAAAVKANEIQLHVPDIRASSYARFVVPKDAAPEIDARAHALADRLATELAGQTGLFGVHLAEAARRIAASSDIQLETTDFRIATRPELVDAYGDALFALHDIGRTSPAVRTPWGWDVILWTAGTPAHERSRDELVAELFPELRRREFQRWVGQVIKRLGVHIELERTAIDALDKAPETEGPQ